MSVGRNNPCPCGSGKKYKRCCESRDNAFKSQPLPPGRFTFECGSYGGPDADYVPSILCYKEVETGRKEHFCLVKPASHYAKEEDAVSEALVDYARAREEAGPANFALSLRHAGYLNLEDFEVVKE